MILHSDHPELPILLSFARNTFQIVTSRPTADINTILSSEGHRLEPLLSRHNFGRPQPIHHCVEVLNAMKSKDAIVTRNLDLLAQNCHQAAALLKPRLLNDNGSSYTSGEMAHWPENRQFGICSRCPGILRQPRARSHTGTRPLRTASC